MMFQTTFILRFPFNKTEALYHSKKCVLFRWRVPSNTKTRSGAPFSLILHQCVRIARNNSEDTIRPQVKLSGEIAPLKTCSCLYIFFYRLTDSRLNLTFKFTQTVVALWGVLFWKPCVCVCVVSEPKCLSNRCFSDLLNLFGNNFSSISQSTFIIS